MSNIAPLATELANNGGFPVKHLSYSSMKEYLQNPRSFLKKYVRYEFDDATGPAFLVGQAVHKALELRTLDMLERFDATGKKEWKPWADTTYDGLAHLHRLFEEANARSLAKAARDVLGIDAEFPTFSKELTNAEVREKHEEIRGKILAYLGNEEALAAFVAMHKDDLIRWPKDGSVEKSEDQYYQAMSNYFAHFEADPEPDHFAQYAERQETAVFHDLDGIQMPVALKAILDRIDENESGIWAVDYKTVDSFTDSDADKADYEIQAGACYFVAQAITGKIPRGMEFVEILKKAPGYGYKFDEPGQDPTPTTYKADLVAIADKHGIQLARKRSRAYLPAEPEKKLLKGDLLALFETNGIALPEDKPTVEQLADCLVACGILAEEFTVTETMDEIRERLTAAGIVAKRPGVRSYVIDFEERPDVLESFLALYVGVVNHVAFDHSYGGYLPNPFAQFGGYQAWEDFKATDGRPGSRNAEGPANPETPARLPEPEPYDEF